MKIKDMGYLCPLCNRTFEMPREVIIQMHNAIMTQIPLPKEELDLFKQLKDLKVIFDVGAREDTEYLDLWPDSEHHLFEPNPIFFEALKSKVKDKPNVFPNNFGLGDKRCEMAYREGLQSFVESDAVNDKQRDIDMVLQLTTLGAYVTDKNISSIDFLKIDTEGFDRKVILGAYNWLKMIKFIQYEHWGEVDNKMIVGLLSDKFDIYCVGYRNQFCMNRDLVDWEERTRLSKYIEDNKLAELV